jgi:hypothetical protein
MVIGSVSMNAVNSVIAQGSSGSGGRSDEKSEQNSDSGNDDVPAMYIRFDNSFILEEGDEILMVDPTRGLQIRAFDTKATELATELTRKRRKNRHFHAHRPMMTLPRMRMMNHRKMRLREGLMSTVPRKLETGH